MATFTITTPAAQDARIVAAFGKILNTRDAAGAPRNATAAEVKAAIAAWLTMSVKEREQADGREAVVVTEVTPT